MQVCLALVLAWCRPMLDTLTNLVLNSPWRGVVAAGWKGKYFDAAQILYAPILLTASSSTARVLMKSTGNIRKFAVYTPLFLSVLPDNSWIWLVEIWQSSRLKIIASAVCTWLLRRRSACISLGMVSLVAVLAHLYRVGFDWRNDLTMEGVGLASAAWNASFAIKHRISESLLGATRTEMLDIVENLLGVDSPREEFENIAERLRYLLRAADSEAEEPTSNSFVTASQEPVETELGDSVEEEMKHSIPPPVVDGVAEDCVICLYNKACSRMTNCNHMIACTSCRRSLVFTKLVSTNLCPRSNVARRKLSSHRMNNTCISCPLCRTEGFLRSTA